MQLINFEDAFVFTTLYVLMTYVLVDGGFSYFNVSMLMFWWIQKKHAQAT